MNGLGAPFSPAGAYHRPHDINSIGRLGGGNGALQPIVEAAPQHRPPPPPTGPDDGLDFDWDEHWDPIAGKHYYHSALRNATTYDPPPGFHSFPHDWEEHVDAEATGRTFFHSPSRGHTTFHVPSILKRGAHRIQKHSTAYVKKKVDTLTRAATGKTSLGAAFGKEGDMASRAARGVSTHMRHEVGTVATGAAHLTMGTLRMVTKAVKRIHPSHFSDHMIRCILKCTNIYHSVDADNNGSVTPFELKHYAMKHVGTSLSFHESESLLDLANAYLADGKKTGKDADSISIPFPAFFRAFMSDEHEHQDLWAHGEASPYHHDKYDVDAQLEAKYRDDEGPLANRARAMAKTPFQADVYENVHLPTLLEVKMLASDIFERCDEDNSGELSPMEVRAAFAESAIYLSDGDLVRFLADVDTEDDGQLDLDEFTESMVKLVSGRPHILDEALERMKRRDEEVAARKARKNIRKSLHMTPAQLTSRVHGLNAQLEQCNIEKQEAVADENYMLAHHLNERMAELRLEIKNGEERIAIMPAIYHEDSFRHVATPPPMPPPDNAKDADEEEVKAAGPSSSLLDLYASHIQSRMSQDFESIGEKLHQRREQRKLRKKLDHVRRRASFDPAALSPPPASPRYI